MLAYCTDILLPLMHISMPVGADPAQQPAQTTRRLHGSQITQLLQIAGGAKGIGLACASCLGNEGAKVLVADINKEEAQK